MTRDFSYRLYNLNYGVYAMYNQKEIQIRQSVPAYQGFRSQAFLDLHLLFLLQVIITLYIILRIE